MVTLRDDDGDAAQSRNGINSRHTPTHPHAHTDTDKQGSGQHTDRDRVAHVSWTVYTQV